MIKRVLCFTNPSYLSLRLKQIVCELPSQKGDADSRMIATHTMMVAAQTTANSVQKMRTYIFVE